MPCLMDNGSDVYAQNTHGLRALHKAAGSGDVAVTKCLINRCVKFNKQYYGIRPLFYAAFRGHVAVVKLLV